MSSRIIDATKEAERRTDAIVMVGGLLWFGVLTLVFRFVISDADFSALFPQTRGGIVAGLAVCAIPLPFTLLISYRLARTAGPAFVPLAFAAMGLFGIGFCLVALWS